MSIILFAYDINPWFLCSRSIVCVAWIAFSYLFIVRSKMFYRSAGINSQKYYGFIDWRVLRPHPHNEGQDQLERNFFLEFGSTHLHSRFFQGRRSLNSALGETSLKTVVVCCSLHIPFLVSKWLEASSSTSGRNVEGLLIEEGRNLYLDAYMHALTTSYLRTLVLMFLLTGWRLSSYP